MLQKAWVIAWQDLRRQMRQGETLLWLFIMPAIFFYFIGTVTSGFAGGGNDGPTPLAVVAETPGFLREQVDLRLRENDFAPVWHSDRAASIGENGATPRRLLEIGPGLTDRVLKGEQVDVAFDTRASALRRDFEIIRIQRALYTTVADLVVTSATRGGAIGEADLQLMNSLPRVASLSVETAGKRKVIPSGFDQAIPGILVMFTLLILLTSGASMLAIERRQGLLRRLAFAPLTRAEIVGGKWGARMGLAIVQVLVALLLGTVLFGMQWGPDLPMVFVVVTAWAAFCASAGLLLGNLANTESQATGLGVLFGNLLAALGGCWWPIEVTPQWMQGLQLLLPTGWAMDALHKLINFEAGAAAAIPNVVAMLVAAGALAMLAARRFRFE